MRKGDSTRHFEGVSRVGMEGEKKNNRSGVEKGSGIGGSEELKEKPERKGRGTRGGGRREGKGRKRGGKERVDLRDNFVFPKQVKRISTSLRVASREILISSVVLAGSPSSGGRGNVRARWRM